MNLQLISKDISDLKPWPNNPRTHRKKQLKQLVDSIKQFGFTNPVLMSQDGYIIGGHGRVEAAKQAGLEEVPTIILPPLSKDQLRALVIADNKLALNAGWDQEMLAIELQALVEVNSDFNLTGFTLAEIDVILDDFTEASPKSTKHPDDKVPAMAEQAVTRRGDLWLLGRHKLLCGDAQQRGDFQTLMGEECADMVFTDPPYNVKIDGNVCGLGDVQHREFAFCQWRDEPCE